MAHGVLLFNTGYAWRALVLDEKYWSKILGIGFPVRAVL